MSTFTDLCQADVEWRVQEIALIKKATALTSASAEIRNMWLKYSIPAIYAIWEGFVTTTFSEYVKVINNEHISVKEIDIRILTYHSFSSLNLHQPPTIQKKREILMGKILTYLDSSIELSPNISTDSNVNYESLTSILNRYGIDPLPESLYKGRLAKFVNIRNKVAHGNNAVIVTPEILSDFSSLIAELMYKIVEILDVHIVTQRYRNSRNETTVS